MKRIYSQEEVEQRMTGRIYVNTDDLNILVKRKTSGAWTMNLGNKWSWVIMGMEVLIIVFIVLFLV